MQVHSHRWVRATAAAQPRWNDQALPVERLCKFYPSGNMSGSVPIYVTQGFYTVNQTYLPCSLVSIVYRNSSGAAKPRWGLNGLHFSAAVSACWWWVIFSIYGLSSAMWCHVLGYGYQVLYQCLFKAPLFFASRFLPHFLVGFCSLFYIWKDWSTPSCLLSWAAVGHCAFFLIC
jgi:hypothetical protein